MLPSSISSVRGVNGLRALVVDDEKLARDDLAWLLGEVDEVCEVLTACSGSDALRTLTNRDDIDVVLLDIQMPGLDGVELVKILRNFKSPPAIAFVTAYDDYAVDAFDLDVCDYLKKPVEQDRLDETLRRVRLRQGRSETAASNSAGALPKLVGRVGNDSFSIDRNDVEIIEAAGDYVRAHLGSNSAAVDSVGRSYLVRESISSLTSAWSGSGFVRIHRSYLVRGSAIRAVRTLDGKRTVDIGGVEYPVSRRYSRLLQDHLGGAS